MRLVSAQPGPLVLRVSPLCLVLITFACGAPARSPAVVSTPAPAARPPEKIYWPRFNEVMSWPIDGAPFENAGHVGAGAMATVRVNPEARASYERLVQDSELPDGTVLAIAHGSAPEGRGGPVYVMQKSHGSWEFLRLGADGSLLEAAIAKGNAGNGCPGCHAEGVADELFGIPRRERGHR